MVRERQARRHTKKSIWDTPKFKKMASEPLGTPIELTREEAIQVARDAFGRGKGRWPSGVDYVKQVRPIWRGLIKKRDG